MTATNDPSSHRTPTDRPPLSRRQFLAGCAAVAAARGSLLAAGVPADRLGICTFSCHIHWAAARKKQPGHAFTDAVGFYRYARQLGADGVQTRLADVAPADLQALRRRAETDGAYLEADIRIPQTKSDLPAFEREIELAKLAGTTVARGVLMGGRRYEVFQTIDQFRQFHAQARQRLALAEPVLRRHRFKLAVENHKDLTAEEQVALLKEIGSEWIGALVDTGNNIALLEAPDATVAALAPLAMSVHLKDMAVQPSATGFLLSEVPCGTGFLDLPRIVATLRRANPAIAFNLEMATRDPLVVPCLTDRYWATFPDRKASHLKPALALVKANPPKQPPPRVSGVSPAQQLADEETNNRSSLAWMHRRLADATSPNR